MTALSNRVKGVYGAAFLSLFFGGLVYVLWRPDSLWLFRWLDAVGMTAPIQQLRSYARPLFPHLPEWLIFSLPNGLWAFSYSLIMTNMWWDRPCGMRYFWLGSIPLVGAGYEFLQYAGLIRGMFCFQDLISCMSGISLGIFMGVLTARYNWRKTK